MNHWMTKEPKSIGVRFDDGEMWEIDLGPFIAMLILHARKDEAFHKMIDPARMGTMPTSEDVDRVIEWLFVSFLRVHDPDADAVMVMNGSGADAVHIECAHCGGDQEALIPLMAEQTKSLCKGPLVCLRCGDTSMFRESTGRTSKFEQSDCDALEPIQRVRLMSLQKLVAEGNARGVDMQELWAEVYERLRSL